ncbi:MAG: toprim domain-containing protein [Patescibacteria group bacterium]|nr:toprim domain-containing protein [Patescibacteria group bacterium]MCL5261742.1 toprim domain-containing protein [Patescibacteria group bacterium]
MTIPELIRQFVDVVSELPGIGPRQAIRLAFYFVNRGKGFNEQVAKAVASLQDITLCKNCFNITANPNGLCDICDDPKRDREVIAIVEKETDLMSMENTKKFNGVYLILGDLKKTGVLDAGQKNRIEVLKDHIARDLGGQTKEIIIAFNPTTYGDINSQIVAKELRPLTQKISRLGRGIPTGGEIEFADEETLTAAIERRS